MKCGILDWYSFGKGIRGCGSTRGAYHAPMMGDNGIQGGFTRGGFVRGGVGWSGVVCTMVV